MLSCESEKGLDRSSGNGKKFGAFRSIVSLLCIVISLCMWSYSVYELERKMCKCACSLSKARRTRIDS